MMNRVDLERAVRKKKQSQPPEERRGELPATDQLWSVIEFSSRFPELTMELVSVLKTAERADKAKEGSQEELKFPDLVPHDPRAANLSISLKKENNAAEEDIDLSAEENGCPTVPAAGGGAHVCICLLAAAFLLSMLLWHGLN